MGMDTSNEHVMQWGQWQYRNLGFSRRTVNRRTGSMKRLAAWCDPLPLLEADHDLIESWLAKFENPATRRAYLSDASRFFKWATRRGLCPADPTSEIEVPKEPQRLPRPIPEAQAALALATARDARVRLGLALAFYAGLRRAEIVGLDAEDITIDAPVPTLIVRRGKGGKDRAVPLHPDLIAEITALAPRKGPVITRLAGGRLSASTLGALIANHMETIGSTHRLHAGRHRFGTKAAEATNGDLQVVADLMGHVSLATTKGYTQMSGARTAAAIGAMPGVA